MNDVRADYSVDGAPFGAFAPGAFVEAVRRAGHKLPDGALFRKTSSLLLGLSGARAERPFDVAVFDTMKARLHPYDNIAEKRVYLTPQHWDPAERAMLADFIGSGAGPFTFVDVGANAGLYSLFAASIAKARARHARIIAIEPDPVMLDRMVCNFAFSGINAEIVARAVTAAPETLRFRINPRNRGENRIAPDGALTISGEPLAAILSARETAFIDAMKIDIEGCEYPALEAFFREAPPSLWPRFLILEISHDDAKRSAKELVLAQGYRLAHENRLNAVFNRA